MLCHHRQPINRTTGDRGERLSSDLQLAVSNLGQSSIKMSKIGESLVSAVIEKVVEMGFKYVKDQWEWQSGMKTELSRLKRLLPKISAVVKAADENQIEMTEPFKAWLWQLKDAVYEAEDVLDDFEYLRLKKIVEEEEAHDDNSRLLPPQVCGCLSQSKKGLIRFGNRALKADPTLKRLREAVRTLDEVAADVGNFFEVLKLTEQQQLRQRQETGHSINVRETSHMPEQKELFGRHKEREDLVRLLTMDCRNQNVTLVSIVGLGGMGKTTLAQHLYNDKRVVEHFDIKIWVCVSNNFDVKGLTKNMLEGVIKKRPDADSLSVLQDQLKKNLMASKRFLLVLDDAWNDKNVSDWAKLFAPLKDGSEGSKILLTTRTDTVAEMAEKGLTGAATGEWRIHLKGLAEDKELALFNEHAFAGETNMDDSSKLHAIGKKIVAKLGGSPLAAKVLGDMLNSNMNDEYWEKILHNNIAKFEEGQNGIISALKLSYDHLPGHLRRCFAYCSMFPPDYKFRKYDLVYMWMAMGFLHKSSTKETPEDIGGSYFDHLLRRSFFDPVGDESKGSYVIHDLLHELAESVSADECLRCPDEIPSLEIADTVRHLSFTNTNPVLLLEKAHNKEFWAKLRSLHLRYDIIDQEHVGVFMNILKSLRCVRLLTVDARNMEALPDAIGVLMHLRYFRFPQFFYLIQNPQYSGLPDSAPKMYNLQAIALGPEGTAPLDSTVIPANFNNVISLRHVVPEDYTRYIAGVGKLTSLMELVFSCARARSGYNIRELKGLNELRTLAIFELCKVKSQAEAREAEMHRKEQLKELKLSWRSTAGILENVSIMKLDEEVLDCLRPSSKLKKLIIDSYLGSKSADWMGAEPVVRNLEYVRLEFCPHWEQLLTLNKLLYLKQLYLRYMPGVKRFDLGDGFQQLEVLELKGLKKCEEWHWGSEPNIDGIEWCPRLRNLQICICPELKVLPSLPSSLEELGLRGVGLTALPKLYSSSPPSSLRGLHIDSCRRLKSLNEGLLGVQQHQLQNLTSLCIFRCMELQELPAQGFQHLCSLSTLKLTECPKLQQLQQYNCSSSFLPSSSLRLLEVSKCGDLDMSPSLSRLLNGAGSLSDLHLENCHNMTSLPPVDVMRTLASLGELTIEHCEQLESLEGLAGVRHLHHLQIGDCPKLVKAAAEAETEGINEDVTSLVVDRLEIQDVSLLRLEPLRRLNSVRIFRSWTGHSDTLMADVFEPWVHRNRNSLEELSLNMFSCSLLPARLKDLSSLKILDLGDAPHLQSMPQLPLSLKTLVAFRCNRTLLERCRKDSGADWPNIKHIPDLVLLYD